MTETAIPAYNLTSLTDKQWEKQLLSQEKIEAAKIDSAKQIELARLSNQASARSHRFELIKNVLGGLACFLVVVTFLVGGIYAIQASSQRSHDKAVECMKTNGKWIDEGSGEGERCERP